MPRAYFEPESLNALAEVFAEAKRRLNVRDINNPTTLDAVASRILALASEGHPPGMILKEIGGEAGITQNGANGGTPENATSTHQQNRTGGADAT
jgi:hypothetical protein